jgi:hypothetical protein
MLIKVKKKDQHDNQEKIKLSLFSKTIFKMILQIETKGYTEYKIEK